MPTPTELQSAYALGASGIRRVCPFDADLDPELFDQWSRGFQARYHETIELVRESKKKRKKEPVVIAAADFETDPFAGPGNYVKPFAAGMYDGASYVQFWGDNAAELIVDHIRSLETPHLIYFHNGGKFDFTFMLDALEPQVFCIGTRIVRAYIRGENGVVHELRDSFAILPVPLKASGEKDSFDYSLMKRSLREKHKKIIGEYLRQDCVALHNIVGRYRQQFGDALTMASAAMKKLNASMEAVVNRRKVYEPLNERQDLELRKFYYGGRVQCFKTGVFEGDFSVFDITSSYPNVMKRYTHPISSSFVRGERDIRPDTDFAIVDAWSDGALPLKNDLGRLVFPVGRHIFHATGHELRAGIELGRVHVFKVLDSVRATQRANFEQFIDEYWNLRKKAKADLALARSLGLADDEAYHTALDLFWKLVMNSAYGKFAQNPRDFKDTMIVRLKERPPEDGWSLSARYNLMDIYTRLSDPAHTWRSYLNVATGASITGAARAELLRGIHLSEGVLYCDTDSIICEKFGGNSDGAELGGWKHEAQASRVAIAGKKMYALFGEVPADAAKVAERMRKYGNAACVKLASKGVRLKADEIVAAAMGDTITYVPEAPTMKLDGQQVWTPRRVTRT